ncbi:hypothetical protein BK004_04500 [bacterium CG10_46_32]|nr:MAG: hypothetical protein BK004_04500 [bacterium CG10_46_32]PIR55769.1 MAG: hypothetical protein COU73_04540 [Parcubacteria group bacterium CG10_big_fil_rev_8_21_14_0_10_46_32]
MENISETNSILDKVMAVKQEEDLASFNPVEIISKLFSELGSREQDILRRRFGLHGKGNETLEQIGKNYNVTRERVRQIENAAIRNIRSFNYFEETVKPVEMVVLAALEKHGGIMSEEHMLEYVLQGEQSDEAYCKHLLFLLEKLTKNRIVREQRTGFRPSWRIDFVDWVRLEQTVAELERILSEQGEPITREDLLEKFTKTPVFNDHQLHFNFDPESAEPIHAHLRATERIRPNPFGEWGLSHWNTVTPKRMGDKIYLVMKKHGKPLHFRDIADHINGAQFDAKKAYPPTVHNELILDERYVLVGRGIYGLKEWGFVPGVVSDVILSILKNTDASLTRDEIVDEVLKQRMVKKGTVYLALSNDERFKKDGDGRFTLVDGIQA